MPNRILKESICTSDSVETLSSFEETFFYRLIVNCDDYGRFDARPAILKARLFPLKDIREKQITDSLYKLSLAGIVQLYECDQKPYLQLSAWERHQQVRSKKSKFPSPDDKNSVLISDDIRCNQEIANVPVIQSNPNPDPNTKNTLCKADALALFENIWKLYPEKKGKGQISESKKLKIADIGEEHMQRCIERYKKELEKDAWRKPQNGSTFFNSGYVDYLDDNYTPSADKKTKTVTSNKFNNFPQRDYDFEALEKQLLNS